MKKRFTQLSPKNHMGFLFMRKSLITTLVSAGPSPCSTWSWSCGCPDRVSSAGCRLMWRAGRCLIGPGQPEDSTTQEGAQQTREESWWINKSPASLPLKHTALELSALGLHWVEPDMSHHSFILLLTFLSFLSWFPTPSECVLESYPK